MKKGTYATMLGIILVLAVITGSCSVPSDAVTIRGLTPPDSSTCAYKPASDSDVFIMIGTLDLYFLNLTNLHYTGGVQVFNWMPDSTPLPATPDILGNLFVNGNDVYAKKAYVTLRKPSEKGTGANFNTISWTVEVSSNKVSSAGGANSPTGGLVLFDLIPTNVVEQIEASPFAPALNETTRVVVEFYVQFESAGGNTVYSNTYQYDMNLCNGCLFPSSCCAAGDTIEVCIKKIQAGCTSCTWGQDSYPTCSCTST
ncbi:MAG: hypothetical protein WC889_11140 [Myxococcota bacterium]|jgi:hypothetical protein